MPVTQRMNDRAAQLSAAIAALEGQRPALGDAVVDTALAPLRRELAEQQARSSSSGQQLKQVTVLFVKPQSARRWLRGQNGEAASLP